VLVISVAIISGIGFGFVIFIFQNEREEPHHIPVAEHNAEIKLPEPVKDSDTSIEEALLERRSIRQYKDDPLTLAEVSQLLWSAQGITGLWRGRTAPSAGVTYPLEVYVVVGNVMCITSPKKFININRTNTNLRGLRKGIKGLSYVMLPSDNVVSEMVPLSYHNSSF